MKYIFDGYFVQITTTGSLITGIRTQSKFRSIVHVTFVGRQPAMALQKYFRIMNQLQPRSIFS